MWRTLVSVYVIAVAVNYPWEVAQASLFTAASHPQNVWLHCFAASMGDGFMVLLLFGICRLALGRRDWFIRPGPAAYGVLLVAGVVLAIIVEWVAVNVLHRWTYSDAMPHIPGLEVGAIPILQMIVTPPLIIGLASAFVLFLRRRGT
jgi:hypothetical protein